LLLILYLLIDLDLKKRRLLTNRRNIILKFKELLVASHVLSGSRVSP
jgi:hypothetical protein